LLSLYKISYWLRPLPRRVAVAVGRFDEVVALAEAQSKCKTIRHGVKSLREPWRNAKLCVVADGGRTRDGPPKALTAWSFFAAKIE